MSFGGPHYGFIAARADYIRRMPGRIVGETTDTAGKRGYRPHAPDPRAAHPPREGDLEHHDEPDAAGARRPRPPDLARAAGAPGGGGDLHGARRVREGAAGRGGAGAAVSRQGNVQGVCGPGRTERPRGRHAPRASRASTRATRSAATTRAWTTRCSSPSPRSGRPRTSTGSRRCSPRCRMTKLIYERSQAGPPRLEPSRATTSRCPRCPRSSPARSRRACPRSPSPSSSATSPSSRPGTSGSTRASTRSAPAR